MQVYKLVVKFHSRHNVEKLFDLCDYDKAVAFAEDHNGILYRRLITYEDFRI